MKNTEPPPKANQTLIQHAGLASSGLLALLILYVFGGVPAPSKDNTALDKFSSKRAFANTKALLGEGEKPHPPGSLANAAVRDRLLKKLRVLGLKPQVQKRWACSPYRSMGCTEVHNVLVRIKGKQKGPAVALSAHYDSISASPGASDDVAGIGSILEITRLLLRKAPHRNPILLLLTDGEESGLAGAVAFAKHPWSKDLAAIVNLEAAGTSGPSDLFQTGPRNAWIIRLFARHAPHPMANSMLPVLVKLSGNITDFDQHSKHGIDGANFAYSGNSQHYHTPLDNLAHLSEGSLRHQGENASALIHALARLDLKTRPKGQLFYQDIAGIKLLSWPTSLNLPLILFSLLLFAGLCFFVTHRKLASVRELLVGMGLLLLAFALAAVAGLVVSSVVGMATGHPKPWWAIQSTFALLYALVAVAGLQGGLLLGGKKTSPWGIWLGVWGFWMLSALLVALFSPAFTPIFLIPLSVALFSALVILFFKPSQHPPLSLPWLMTLLVWLPMIKFANTIGFSSFNVIPVILTLSPILPLTQSLAGDPRTKVLLWGTMAAVVLMTLIVIFQPRADKEHPIGINIVTAQDANSKQSRTQLEVMWHFKDAPTAVIPKHLAAKFKLGLFPGHYATGGFLGFSGYVDGPAFKALPPRATLNADGSLLTIQSQRGATSYQLCINTDIIVTLPGGIVSPGVLNMGTQKFEARLVSNRKHELRVHRFYGPEQGPLTLSLTRKPNAPKSPLVLWIGDLKNSLAPSSASYVKARGALAVPFHHGDRTLVGSWLSRPNIRSK